MAEPFFFRVSNQDITVEFSCDNYHNRMNALVRNLCLNKFELGAPERKASFLSEQRNTRFSFGDGPEIHSHELEHDAVFFENTDYPLLVKGRDGVHIESIELTIADHAQEKTETAKRIRSRNGVLYGAINFHNQVGKTDFAFEYTLRKEGIRRISFSTEVLSYKLDYRSDLKTILADVEHEYAMLSYAFLRDTYLTFRTKAGRSTELIWWQIFRSNYAAICAATKTIINRPKRRLKTTTRYERAERLRTLPQEMEVEYLHNKDNPAHVYRTEEYILSHDTKENRFLKYALAQMLKKYREIRPHIKKAFNLANFEQISKEHARMESELVSLVNHPFFRGIGPFKGFSQESLVMKQASGYRDILRYWVELQQGFALQEGMKRLEVKDISDLYEIWCFIKVKNIVAEVLQEIYPDIKQEDNDHQLTNDFIVDLVHGGNVSFTQTNGIELASVSYNVQTSDSGKKETEEKNSLVGETTTFTTDQRPDIVLRLSKENDTIKYTYLFDAKYRINETLIHGEEVPPEDALNQIHRYRDAIYYKEQIGEAIKKEVVAGYVLFPGNVSVDNFDNYYYEKSNKAIGIGVFPLKPDKEKRNDKGELVLNPKNSEQLLRKQIRAWLEDKTPRETLRDKAVPQKGLEYSDEPVAEGMYLLSAIDSDVNDNIEDLVTGKGTCFISGFALLNAGFNFHEVKYLAVVRNHNVNGYYRIEETTIVDMTDLLMKKGSRYSDKPYRIRFSLGTYTSYMCAPYGLDKLASRGIVLTRRDFRALSTRESQKEKKSGSIQQVAQKNLH